MKILKKLKRISEKIHLRRCETRWSAREIASVTLSPEQERHTENVFHMLLIRRIKI